MGNSNSNHKKAKKRSSPKEKGMKDDDASDNASEITKKKALQQNRNVVEEEEADGGSSNSNVVSSDSNASDDEIDATASSDEEEANDASNDKVEATVSSSEEDNDDERPSTIAKNFNDEKQSHSKEIGNGLTEIIPGYTAPLQLNTGTSKLPSLGELRQAAQQSDVSTHKFCRQLTNPTKSTGFLPSSYVSSYTKGPKQDAKKSAMKGWFNMESTTITDEVKADLAVISNRTYLDPKRFYKKADKFGKHIQIGTVVDSSSGERYTKKERQQTLVDEVMKNDTDIMDYTKRKYRQVQQRRQEATAHHYKKKRKMNHKKVRSGF